MTKYICLGANSATLISFGQDILFGDKYIKAGTYAFLCYS